MLCNLQNQLSWLWS